MKTKMIYKNLINNKTVLFLLLFCIGCQGNTEKEQSSDMQETYYDQPGQESKYYVPPFNLENPDYKKSPHTGMTREEWVRCGIHILEGAFQYVHDLETPMLLPKFPGKSYPHGGNENADPSVRSAAIFEALARTFNVAAPILANQPDLEINEIKLIDYYKYHLLELLTNPDCSYYIGPPKDRPFQPTCELGNLSLWNLVLPEVFWNRLTDDEKQKVADIIYDWGTSWTWTHNWRYFNVMMLTFLDHYGYKTDTSLMLSHIDHLLLHYAGDGWYRDTGYDYYTVHVFQLYHEVWIASYGRDNAPGRVKVIREQQKEFYDIYPLIFGKEGTVNMYGRSILYRLGASAAMSASFLGSDKTFLSPGLARRVASGALLQFVTHPKFFNQGIPALGFYGHFEPSVQPYSCSASPYWMFLSYIALALPENHPFWSEKEEMGHWGNIDKNEVYSRYSQGMGMLISNHGPSGTTEFRPGKIHNQNPNYSKLVYNTAFPWEAQRNDGIASSAFSVFLPGNETAELPIYADACGFRKDVLYRQATFDYKLHGSLNCYIDMASIVIPGGEIRIERVRKIRKSKFYLGHFSLPHINTVPEVIKRNVDDKNCIIAKIPGRQLAITNYMGWDKIDTLANEGLHAESFKSTLLYASYEESEHRYGQVQMLISVLLHKNENTEWLEDELQPIKKIEQIEKGVPYHLGGMIITLKNNKSYEVDFENIDGKSSRH